MGLYKHYDPNKTAHHGDQLEGYYAKDIPVPQQSLDNKFFATEIQAYTDLTSSHKLLPNWMNKYPNCET